MRHLIALLAVAGLCLPALAQEGGADETEKKTKKERILEKFDESGNGKLDPEEREKIREKMKKRRGGRGGRPPRDD